MESSTKFILFFSIIVTKFSDQVTSFTHFGVGGNDLSKMSA